MKPPQNLIVVQARAGAAAFDWARLLAVKTGGLDPSLRQVDAGNSLPAELGNRKTAGAARVPHVDPHVVSETPRSPTPKQAQAAASRLLACRIPKRQSKLKPLPQVVKTPCLPNSETAKLLVLRVGVLAAGMPNVDPHVAYRQSQQFYGFRNSAFPAWSPHCGTTCRGGKGRAGDATFYGEMCSCGRFGRVSHSKVKRSCGRFGKVSHSKVKTSRKAETDRNTLSRRDLGNNPFCFVGGVKRRRKEESKRRAVYFFGLPLP